jgi:uncharacterized protein with ParB-like and HNH nuclease domain
MPNQLKNVQTIFNERLFRVPDYQRGYSWGEDQLEAFWHDIKNLPSGRNHYTGLLSLEPVRDAAWRRWDEDLWLIKAAGCQPYFVVDGQQRLITIVMLIHCLLAKIQDTDELLRTPKQRLVEKYIRRESGISRAYIFGYEKDNPSYEYLKAAIFGDASNQWQGIETLYTANMAKAKAFFTEKITGLKKGEIEDIFGRVTLRLMFNEFEIADDLDVFVAFETMNNRGKPLSKLELLKNRLIYLSTLVRAKEGERRALRSNINEAWKTVYMELGKDKENPLDDDDFLRNHWIMYFKYSREESNEYARFLLDEHFTAPRATSGKIRANDIQRYITSIQASVRAWYTIHHPETASTLDDNVRRGLERLSRLGRGAFAPVIMAALVKKADEGKIEALLKGAENFVFVVSRMCRRRADTGDNEFYGTTSDYYKGEIGISQVTEMVNERVAFFFNYDRFKTYINELFENQEGFYSWNGLRYFLFEYEQHLQRKNRSNTAKIDWNEFNRSSEDYVTVEHIFPQQADKPCWRKQFGRLREGKRNQLLHSLGNLLPLAHRKNVSLSNECFMDKKKPKSGASGYYNGSYSEIEIAQDVTWTPKCVLKRGVRLLSFLEERWNVNLGNRNQKRELLGLDFLGWNGRPR